MRNSFRITALLAPLALVLSLSAVMPATQAQITSNTDVDLSQNGGDDSECAVAINPTNKNQIFVSCNVTSGPGLFAARSSDRGVTWNYPGGASLKTIADGDAGQGPTACCDPSLAWDSFGNLFVTYIDQGVGNIVTLLSTDGGATFSVLAQFPGSVDQPTVVAGGGAVWVVWNSSGSMVARGAAVTGLGSANIGAFGTQQAIPGTANCSFGDIAVSATGTVVQACETPTGGEGPGSILVNTDTAGPNGPANSFSAAVTATTTNVGGFDHITPQNGRSVDAEAGLAFDTNPASPHFGRLYLVYTEETPDESNNTDILLRFSDNNGATWSASAPVSVDPTNRAQFLPKIAVNSDSGNIAICWHDARNSATNTAMQIFCSTALRTDATPIFQPNALVSDGASTSNGAGIEFGDYSGLAYYKGLFTPVWADTSNSTGNNPNGTANFDAYTDRVTWNPLANEGDPHMRTADGIRYNFQSEGEFTALRDSTGLEIQTRQSPVSTADPWFDSYTGLSTCVSVNTALAARVGTHRVTFEPNIKGNPDSSGLQLRVDGVLTTLPPNGLSLGSNGRVLPSANNGIEIDFPDGTIMIATPGWWGAPQNTWFMNIDVFRTEATDGLMGSLARGSWLPALPNGTSVGAMPGTLHQKFVTLNQTYANAWRVTNKTSLFDYAPGTSTATFTNPAWPAESGAGACVVPHVPPAKPLDIAKARQICEPVADRTRREDCIFDVVATGQEGFGKLYLITQRLTAGATVIRLTDNLATLNLQTTRPVPFFAATVSRLVASNERPPTGSVQFLLDGENYGEPVPVDANGRAVQKAGIRPGKHVVSARFIPGKDGSDLPSTSAERAVSLEGGR